MIAKEDLEKIRKNIDIVKYLHDRGTEVTRAGASWTGLCPIHSERTPSFHVKPEAKTWHCFGCGKGGDIFSLVQDMDDLSFYGAILSLAEYAGIEIQETEDNDFKKIQHLYRLTNLASAFFRKNFVELPEDHPAKQNLAARNLLELAMTDETVGFAPASGLLPYLQASKFTMEEILEAGLATKPESPVALFRNRLIWSIRNIQGKTVGFTARKIYENDNGPKYINSPQTPLYNKSKTLFGLEQAHKAITEQQSVYVVEGQTDVMALRAIGVMNVVAPNGTAFVKDHATILQRLADRARSSKKFTINFCFDGDKAGIAAAKKVFTTDPSLQTSSNVISLPYGDPCELRINEGDEGLRKALENKTPLLEFILKNELTEWDVTTPEGQTGFLKQAIDLLSDIDDSTMLEAYQRKVSYWSGVPLSNIVSRRPSRRNNQKTEEAGSGMQVVSLGLLRQRVIASLLQFPYITLPILDEMGINADMFQKNGRIVFEEAYKVASEYKEDNDHSFDSSKFTEPNIAAQLMHEDIISDPNETSQRKAEIIGAICNVFLTNYRISENSKIQAQVLSAAENAGGEDQTDEEIFRQIMESRKGLVSTRKPKRLPHGGKPLEVKTEEVIIPEYEEYDGSDYDPDEPF